VRDLIMTSITVHERKNKANDVSAVSCNI